jgi:thiol:disulfide interchange protein DsbA
VSFLGLIVLLVSQSSLAADSWTEGVNYFPVVPAQATSVAPGKVEVLEVFSYGCPACNAFLPIMNKLAASLPSRAQVAYLPASFNPSEDWPMFQRAFLTAQAMGIADRTHDAVFDAVWKTGELGIMDTATNSPKKPLPSIEDAAHFYQRHAGIKPDDFLNTAKSFSVDVKIRNAEKEIVDSHVDRTPTIIVNGKYRLHVQSAGGTDQLVKLVNWLVARESGAAK